MMDFFKQNPSALLDALPTPPGSDNGEDQAQMNPHNTGFDTTLTKCKKDEFDTRRNRSLKSNNSLRSNISQASFKGKWPKHASSKRATQYRRDLAMST